MKPHQSLIKNDSGSITALSALLLFGLMAILAFVFDLGHLFIVKNQLQNAADAGSLAGARAIFLNNIPPNPDWSAGQTTATNAVRDNNVDNSALLGGQVETGYWDKTWTASTAPANLKPTGIVPGPNDFPAVKVIVSKSAGFNNGPVNMTIAQILGINTVDVSANAVATIGFPGYVGKGMLFPIAVTKDMADKYWDTTFSFKIGSDYHYPSDEAGQWTSFLVDENNVPYIQDLIAHGNPDPVSVGQNIWIEPGTKTRLYTDVATCIGQVVFLPIVQDIGTHAYNKVLGFLPFYIEDSVGKSSKYVQGHFAAGNMIPGSGPGGPGYGALTPPRLVK